MAEYTMELRDYIEMWTQTQSGLSWADKIEAGRPNLFDFDYPIYDPDYKQDFETHFIKNFYMSEIGFETEGLFKFKLESWLLINMPYFNKLFESELLTYDPLENQSITNSQDKTGTQSSTIDGTSSGNGSQDVNGTLSENKFDRQLGSNTPDERLTITNATSGTSVIDGSDIYANEINENTENNSRTSTSNTTNTTSETTNVSNSGNTSESVNQTNKGKTGSITYAEMLQKHRSTFLRIEKQIFDEIRKELFMLVY